MLNKSETLHLMRMIMRYIHEQNTFEAFVSLKKLKKDGDEATLRDITRQDPYIRHLINSV